MEDKRIEESTISSTSKIDNSGREKEQFVKNGEESSRLGIRDMTIYQLFTYGQKIWNELQNTDLSSSDIEYQVQLKQALQYFMMASFQFDKQSLISKNEELDDIRTDILKYLLIPYYLADLFVLVVDKDNRLKNLKNAKTKILGFLNRCEMIGIVHKDDLEIITREGKPNPTNRRNELISRGKRDKEVREQMEHVLKRRLELIKKNDKDAEEENDCGDEEVERKFSLLLLREAVGKSVSMLEMMDTEMSMLQQVEKIKEKNGGVMPAPPPPKPSGIGNFQILPDGRRVMLDKVFRPSHILPTISPEEAAHWEMHNGGMVSGPGGEASKKQEDDHSDEEDGKEQDMDKLKKKREWDDFVDDNPRGWGNLGGR